MLLLHYIFYLGVNYFYTFRGGFLPVGDVSKDIWLRIDKWHIDFLSLFLTLFRKTFQRLRSIVIMNFRHIKFFIQSFFPVHYQNILIQSLNLICQCARNVALLVMLSSQTKEDKKEKRWCQPKSKTFSTFFSSVKFSVGNNFRPVKHCH